MYMFGWIDVRLVSCWDCNFRHVQQLLLDDDNDDALLSLLFCAADAAAVLLFSLSIIIRPCPGGRCSIVLHLLGQLQWLASSSLCFPKPPFFSCSCRADDLLPLLLLLAAAAATMAASRAVKGEVSISAAAIGIVVEKSTC